MEKETLSVQIGQRLKRIRQSRGLSLDALAEVTDVSKPMLGQIERGVSNPTVATLWKIASGLNVPFTAFVAEEPSIRVQRAKEQSVFFEDDARFEVYNTFATAGSPVEVFRLRLLPGCRRCAEAHAQGVVESLTVASGRMRMQVQDTMYDLSEGDALQFTADTPHVYENPFGVACDAHLVILNPDTLTKRVL
jgi:XRE family transcriptional regulator, regulator of sulfur utilization